MPHVNGSDGDDLGDADEIKVFKHDEECEEEKKLIAEERQSDSLTEDKSSLVTEGESQVNSSTWCAGCPLYANDQDVTTPAVVGYRGRRFG